MISSDTTIEAPASGGASIAKGRSVPRAYAPIAVVGGLMALLPIVFHDSPSKMLVITIGALFVAYGVAFNIIFGSTGQLFLCVGALAGIGGYSSAILSEKAGIPMLLSIVIAGVASSLTGGLLSWIAVRRSLDTIFIGIVTLTFSLSYENFVLGRGDLTGGEDGFKFDSSADSIIASDVASYYIFVGLAVVYLGLYLALQRSHIGWAFKALRDDEVAAELAGVNVTRYRVYAGLIGSAMLGVAGAVFAHHRGFVGTSTFAFGTVDVRVLVMLAFGGIGSLLGPVMGAVVFTILDEILVDYAQLREVLYGIITIGLFLGFRKGIIPSLERFRKTPTPTPPGDSGSE